MKQDHKRLSKEKHEIAYVRKLARHNMAAFKKCAWNRYTFYIPGEENRIDAFIVNKDEIIRLCKAVLKFAK